jgi:hypothetical protein
MFASDPNQGCQIFLDTIHQKGENVTNEHQILQTACRKSKRPQSKPNGHKRYQYFHSKAFQNIQKFGVWYKNIPSGNPDPNHQLDNSVLPKWITGENCVSAKLTKISKHFDK